MTTLFLVNRLHDVSSCRSIAPYAGPKEVAKSLQAKLLRKRLIKDLYDVAPIRDALVLRLPVWAYKKYVRHVAYLIGVNAKRVHMYYVTNIYRIRIRAGMHVPSNENCLPSAITCGIQESILQHDWKSFNLLCTKADRDKTYDIPMRAMGGLTAASINHIRSKIRIDLVRVMMQIHIVRGHIPDEIKQIDPGAYSLAMEYIDRCTTLYRMLVRKWQSVHGMANRKYAVDVIYQYENDVEPSSLQHVNDTIVQSIGPYYTLKGQCD